MAQYKVPQDVEADDKLLGPFSFRQFIYLMVAAGAIAIAWILFQVFPLLALIPAPIIIFFVILALPIKKDQPMETYLAAVISFYLKPRKRFWTPGQKESTILITAPKQTEPTRSRNITEEEAVHRLSFLSELVDSEGYSIKSNPMKEEYLAEANNITDILDSNSSYNINKIINEEQTIRHNEILNQMRSAIKNADDFSNFYQNNPSTTQPTSTTSTSNQSTPQSTPTQSTLNQPITQPIINQTQSQNPTQTTVASKSQKTQANSNSETNTDIINLANNKEYSIATIQKEADRLNKKNNNEVYISLH